MELLDYEKLKKYMKLRCDSCSLVDYFLGYDEQELTHYISSVGIHEKTIVVMLEYKGALSGNNQRTLSGREVRFAVLRKGGGGFEKDTSQVAICENVGFVLLSRILYDSRFPESEWLYDNFDQDTVEFMDIRSLTVSNLIGMEFGFELKTPQPLNLNPDDWEDIDFV